MCYSRTLVVVNLLLIYVCCITCTNTFKYPEIIDVLLETVSSMLQNLLGTLFVVFCSKCARFNPGFVADAKVLR